MTINNNDLASLIFKCYKSSYDKIQNNIFAILTMAATPTSNKPLCKNSFLISMYSCKFLPQEFSANDSWLQTDRRKLVQGNAATWIFNLLKSNRKIINVRESYNRAPVVEVIDHDITMNQIRHWSGRNFDGIIFSGMRFVYIAAYTFSREQMILFHFIFQILNGGGGEDKEENWTWAGGKDETQSDACVGRSPNVLSCQNQRNWT